MFVRVHATKKNYYKEMAVQIKWIDWQGKTWKYPGDICDTLVNGNPEKTMSQNEN